MCFGPMEIFKFLLHGLNTFILFVSLLCGFLKKIIDDFLHHPHPADSSMSDGISSILTDWLCYNQSI